MKSSSIAIAALVCIILVLGTLFWVSGSAGNLGRGGDEQSNPPPHAIQQ